MKAKDWLPKSRTKTLIGLILVLSMTFPLFRWFEHSQVYIPYGSLERTGEGVGDRWEDIWINASDGTRLNAWFFSPDPKSPRAHIAVLLCHGNAGNISHRFDYYELLLGLGVNVLAFDYRGYGRSAGKPSEEGTYLDAEASYRWLNERGFAPTNIVALGESLGGAVATELALRVSLGGIILVSTFTSIPAVGAELFPILPTKWLCTIQYDTFSKLPRINTPVLIMHSRDDTIIRFRHAERNFSVANEPKTFCEVSGDHNDTLVSDLARHGEAIDRFLGFVSQLK